MSDDGINLEQFNGTVRLFPLPNVVLFPNVIQPLHIFEPRYRQMTTDSLDSDRLIAPALLRPGWEGDYEGRPVIHDVVCVGKIVNEQRLADGRFNFLLRGLSRARVLEEVPNGKLYRAARVELLCDGLPPLSDVDRRLRGELRDAVQAWFPTPGAAQEQLRKLLRSDLALGVLCDILAFAVPLPVAAKQQLLEELHVERRMQGLLQLLTSTTPPTGAASADRQFPPDFSSN